MKLLDEIRETISNAEVNTKVRERYLRRLKKGKPTRVDNPISHFCAYFLPYDVAARKVYIVAHKKSGLWLSPGGHIEPGEKLFDTLTREIKEELGIANPLSEKSNPLLLTVTDIKRDPRACKVHFDVWYFLPTNGKGFQIDTDEFHETRWVSIAEARSLITDENNLQALDFVERNLFT